MTTDEYGAVRIMAYYYSKGMSDSEVLAKTLQRLPGYSPQLLDELATYAAASLQVAERFDPNKPAESLFDVLGGFDPPDTQVSVSLLFKYTKPDGSVRENTIKVLTNWYATMGDIYSEALADLAGITSQYGNVDVEYMGVVGGIMTPADEQV